MADEDEDDEGDSSVKRAKTLWKERNPNDTLKEQRRRLQAGEIEQLPWMTMLAEATLPMSTFGTKWPMAPVKGDHFIKTDRQPTEVYKYNGDEWIRLDKNQSDVYAYNDNYIDFLIEKISQGEYDPELLNDAERAQIEDRLRKGIA